MFLVFNRQKIYTYLVTICTVIILLVFATVNASSNKLILTSSSEKELPIYSVKTDEKKVAITMNCAWNADDIDLILETLKKHNVKITFFVVGDWVDKYPEAVKKINADGHEIGNHSNTHPHVCNLSYDENMKEIELCNNKIKLLTDKKVNLYRAPYGEYNDVVIRAAKAIDCKTIQWNIDSLDYKNLSGNEMWNRISKKLNPGSIILMHNGTKCTGESLDFILNNIAEQGYEITTVSDLIYGSDYYIDANGTQIKK